MRLFGIMLAWVMSVTGASAQCVIGGATVPCDTTPLRTRIVSPTGDANHRTIQAALNAARAGDRIYVKAGTYAERVTWTANGTATRPIVLMAYPGQTPQIRPSGATEADSVTLRGAWAILDGVDIAGGWHGVAVHAPNVLLRNLSIHDNGAHDGQGVIVTASNVAVTRSTILRNGLTSSHPWLSHGVYVSDYYRRGIVRVGVTDSTLSDHGGAGVQVWHSSAIVRDVQITGNTFQRNAVDVILTNTERVTLGNNLLVHDGPPPTTAPVSTWFWFELSKAVQITGNTLRASGFVPTCAGITGANQSLADLFWSSNAWTWPVGCQAFTDADLNAAGGH